MILYKGNTLVEGKHFIYENDMVTYQGKVYGNFYLFKNSNDLDLVLNESDLGKLKLYEHSMVTDAENADDLRTLLVAYFDKGISILDSDTNVIDELITYFTDFKNHLDQMGCTYQYTERDIEKSQLLDFIRHYLNEARLNVSEVSIPELYTTICILILNLWKYREDVINGDME